MKTRPGPICGKTEHVLVLASFDMGILRACCTHQKRCSEALEDETVNAVSSCKRPLVRENMRLLPQEAIILTYCLAKEITYDDVASVRPCRSRSEGEGPPHCATFGSAVDRDNVSTSGQQQRLI